MEFTLCLIGLFLSFFFAGSETAFISSSRLRFEIRLRNNLRSALFAEKYYRNPDIFLSTTLVGNNIANVLASSYATVFLIAIWDETLSWAIITLTILLFGEIIPKVIFRTHANNLILKIVYPIRFFQILLSPIIHIANKISSSVLKILNIGDQKDHSIFNKEEIEVLIREAKISGLVDEDEHKIIRKVLSLPETLVREAMTPRTALKAIEENDSITNFTRLIAESGKTKIPVFKKNIDNIIGIAFMYDLFLKPKSIREIIHPIIYTPENKKCNELIQEFRQNNTSISIVIDEYGGTAGVITIEDLMEELFGEIEELPILENRSIRALNQSTWQVLADESIETVNEILNIEIPTGNYETLSGFILYMLGHIPKLGEQIVMPKYEIVVTGAKKNKIEEVRIIKRN